MKKIVLIVTSILWLCSLLALIIALTNVYPVPALKERSLVVGILFISLTYVVRRTYVLYRTEKK